MSALTVQAEPSAADVRCSDDELIVTLTDGSTLSVPLTWFPRLASASPGERADYELLGNGSGIHWPAIDEDISILALLAGNPSGELHNPVSS